MKSFLFMRAIVNRNRVKFLYNFQEVILEPYYISRNKTGKKVLYGRIGNSNEIKIFEYDKMCNIKVFVYENTINKADLIVYNNYVLDKDITLADESLTLVTFARITKQVFNNCLQCHGGSTGQPAAGLYLLPDSSYKYLVEVNSVNSFGQDSTHLLRVKPFFVDSSFIIKVLNNDNLNYDHLGKNIATSDDIQLITYWINNGALNN